MARKESAAGVAEDVELGHVTTACPGAAAKARRLPAVPSDGMWDWWLEWEHQYELPMVKRMRAAFRAERIRRAIRRHRPKQEEN